MKKQSSPPEIEAISSSRALIAIPVAAPRAGFLEALVRAIAGILLLPVRIPILALVGAARGAAWLGARAGRGVVALLLLPFRALALLARLIVGLARLIARGILFLLWIPFLVLRLLVRGVARLVRGAAFLAVAVTVPVLALAWGGLRSLAAGVAAVARGVAWALVLLGRLLLKGASLLVRGILETFRDLVVGLFVCVRGIVRAAFWLALQPLRLALVAGIALARGARNGAVLLVDAMAVVCAGIAEIVRGIVVVAPIAGRAVARGARPLGSALATRQPHYAGLLPLGTIAVLAVVEMLLSGVFPFATLALLLVGACAYMAILAAPASLLAVLLAWGLAVAAGWRAENIPAETPAWIDALVYLAALAAIRSAYVTARVFVREAPAVPRNPEQERAHRRASRAIGIVLAVQCVVFAIWSGAEGRLHDAPLFGELLLVGAGMALAWVVRTGHYVRTAQAVLSVGALAAIALAIATQLRALAAGRLFTAASLGAAFFLLLVAGALVVVVHTRLIDAEHGA